MTAPLPKCDGRVKLRVKLDDAQPQGRRLASGRVMNQRAAVATSEVATPAMTAEVVLWGI